MTIAAALILTAFALVVATLVLRRRREAAWRIFVRRHHLRVESAGDGLPTATGEVAGRRCRVFLRGSNSGAGIPGIEEVELAVEARVEVPSGFTVRSRTTRDGVAGVPDPTTGDAAFDHLARVESRDLDQLRSFLTPTRRAALALLVHGLGADPGGADGSRLWVRRRQSASRSADLDRDLSLLLAAAEGLETGTPRGGESASSSPAAAERQRTGAP